MKKENKTFAAILNFLYKLNGYGLLILLFSSLFLLTVFIIGNYHDFNDNFQSVILKHLSTFVILIDFLCIFGIIESILLLIFEKVRILYFVFIFLMILLFIFGLTLLGFSGIVENLSEGLSLGLAYVK